MRLRRRLLNPAGRSEFRKAVLTMVGGTAVAQALVAASSPLLTRVYSPADFGTYAAVFATLISLLGIFSTLSYQNAIALPDDDVLAANVLGVSLAVAAVVGLATLVVLLVAGEWVSGPLGTTSIGNYALLLVIGQMVGAAVSALMMWALRTKSFSVIARNAVTQSGYAGCRPARLRRGRPRGDRVDDRLRGRERGRRDQVGARRMESERVGIPSGVATRCATGGRAGTGGSPS